MVLGFYLGRRSYHWEPRQFRAFSGVVGRQAYPAGGRRATPGSRYSKSQELTPVSRPPGRRVNATGDWGAAKSVAVYGTRAIGRNAVTEVTISRRLATRWRPRRSVPEGPDQSSRGRLRMQPPRMVLAPKSRWHEHHANLHCNIGHEQQAQQVRMTRTTPAHPARS